MPASEPVVVKTDLYSMFSEKVVMRNALTVPTYTGNLTASCLVMENHIANPVYCCSEMELHVLTYLNKLIR